jgi:cytochrome c2
MMEYYPSLSALRSSLFALSLGTYLCRMNQVRYIVNACLILLLIVAVTSVFSRLSSTKIIADKPVVFDYSSIESSKPRAAGKGKSLFQQNCASCHSLDKVLTGPALRGVGSRGPWAEDRKNLVKYIKNPAAFIQTTAYTIELQKQFGQIMPSFNLPDNDIETILDYILNAGPTPTSLPGALVMNEHR